MSGPQDSTSTEQRGRRGPWWTRRPSGDRLVLAPVDQRRAGPDLDTRAMPTVPGPRAGAAPAPVAVPPVPMPPVPAPATPQPQAAGTAALFPASAPARRPVGPSLSPRRTGAPSGRVVGVPRVDVQMSDGRRLTLQGTVLVGRNPTAEGGAHVVLVDDPGRSVSKTHLQVEVTSDGVWVTDRGSTNGTVVTLPDGGQVVCGAGQRVRLRAGSTVTLGEHALLLLGATPAV